MCGIIGAISKFIDDPEASCFVEKGLNELTHRGPDSQSVKKVDPKVVLGHARLAIIDLSEGANQPMLSESGEKAIVFNGEIYNYRELRETLKGDYEFRTNSDTEVILACYQVHGIEKTLGLLDGFFAFALYDLKKRKIYLARDRVGKKPLYLYRGSTSLLFSSELRVFRNLQGFRPELSSETLQSILLYKYSKSLSIFSNVEMINPGSFAEIELDGLKVRIKKYFDFTELVSEGLYKQYSMLSEKDLLEVLDSIMHRAIKKRLSASDVQICSINSGGLDSSLVSSIAAQYQEVDLFHVDVEKRSEYEFACKLKNHLGLPMHTFKLNESNIVDLFREASMYYEYYMVHLNNAGIYLLSSEIRSKGYKVVLGGETADEVFGGYSHYNHFLKLLPMHKAVSSLKITKSIERMLESKFLKILDPLLSLSHNKKINMTNNLSVIDNKKCFQELSHTYFFIDGEREKFLQTFLLFDLYRYLQPLFLRGDKLFMANGVELRLPFADIEVLRFGLNLPSKWKKGKYLLKKLAEKYVPQCIIYRKKEGFGVPLERLLLADKKAIMGIPAEFINNASVSIALLGAEIYLDSVFGLRDGS